MNTAAPSTVRKKADKGKKRRAILALLLLLLFLLLATSCIVGFLLGRTADPGRYGALIDTIVLTPEPTPEAEPVPSTGEIFSAGDLSERINILGVVKYTDGMPFTQGSVELHSQPRYAQVDGEGRFQFDQVETGEHELTVLDQSGNALVSRTIRVVRDAETDAYIDYENMVCVLHIQALTVEVELELTIEKTPGEVLEVALTGVREEDAPAPSASPTAQPGATPTPASGVKPSARPGAAPAVSPTNAPVPAPSAAPAVPPDATPTNAPVPAPSAAPAVSPDATPTKTPVPAPSIAPAVSPDVTPTQQPDDTGTVEVERRDDGENWQAWTQQAEIDLFRPLDGSDEQVIAPGSKGYYLFQLKNGRNRKICFTMALKEGSFHIPLEYRIATDEANSTGLTEWQTASVDTETLSGTVQFSANGHKRYRIEWRWPFEGDDAVDTALGLREDRIYTLSLILRVEDAA